MLNSKLQEAFSLLEKNSENSSTSGSKTDEQIKLLEEILGISLPLSYKEFLSKYGRGGIGGADFFGIDESVEKSESVVETINNRQYGLPLQYIIITKDGDGSYCAIDCSKRNEHGESPIIRWSSFFKPEKIAEDFGEFMLSDLRNILENP